MLYLFAQGHKCKSKLFLLVHQDDDLCDVSPSLGDETSVATFIAFIKWHQSPSIFWDTWNIKYYFTGNVGYSFPETLRLQGTINNKDLINLIDGGSTPNFIQDQIVKS